MFPKKPRVFLKKRRVKFARLDALAALGAIMLIALLSFMAFHGGRGDHHDPVVALTGQETAQTAPTTAIVGTEVESVSLALTGIDTTPLLIGGLSMVLLGTAMELSARRRRSV
jgi:hypothetical protein